MIGPSGQRSVPLALLVLLPLVAAGCVGLGGSDDAGSDGTDGPTQANASVPEEEPMWTLSTSVRIEFTAGVGVPFTEFVTVGLDVVCPHGNVQVELPAGGSFLAFEVGEPAINTSEPGAGFLTLAYRYEDEAWKDAEGEEIGEPVDARVAPPSEGASVNLTEPAEGTWQVAVWPHGPVVNKVIDLWIHAQGHGPPSGDLADDDRYGAGCGR